MNTMRLLLRLVRECVVTLPDRVVLAMDRLTAALKFEEPGGAVVGWSGSADSEPVMLSRGLVVMPQRVIDYYGEAWLAEMYPNSDVISAEDALEDEGRSA